MNCLLLSPEELAADGRAVISGRRCEHARRVLAAAPGDTVKVALRGGRLGQAVVQALDADSLTLQVTLDRDPPPKLPVTLLLALPRPKVLSRTLAAATSLGVARIVLMNSWRVEKAYWQSDRLLPATMAAAIDDGLEQAVDCVPPEVTLERLFVPFCEQRLPALCQGATCLVAHPVGQPASAVTGPLVLAVGPEGGFIPAELGSLARAGFIQVSLGPRVLRVETAVAALLGRLSPPC